jgi:hypothetical protein
MDDHRKTLKEGNPEDKIRAWLQLTINESGHSKQGVSISYIHDNLRFNTELNLGLDEHPRSSP